MSNLTWRCAPRFVLLIGMAIAVFFSAHRTHGDTLAYSFESGTEGFAPNGGAFTVEQDTIGATEGSSSLKVAIPGLAPGFVGALTPMLPPAIGDPPGMDHVLYDVTITEEFSPPLPDPPGFAVIGLTIFGVTQPDFPGGQVGKQVQWQDQEFHIDGLEVGTYRDVPIILTPQFHPITFELATFNEIFGTVGSGPNDIIPTGFQLYFNKTVNADYPLTVYIDNIRVGTSSPGDYNGNGTVDAADYVLWRNGGPLMNEVADPGTVSPADYTEWRARFGNMAASGSSATIGVVPEPGSALLLVIACACWWGRARNNTAR